MKCPDCSFDNPEGIRFCGQCGRFLRNTCPNCNSSNPIQFRFCGNCGVPLLPNLVHDDLAEIRKYIPSYLAEKIRQSRGHIEGERKIVTAVFADISGFTPLAETHDPEEVSGIVTTCHTMLGDIIYEYGGVVDKIIGDGLMSIFGVPVYEDDPERAILAAMDMRRDMVALSQKFKASMDITLGLSIGINTGIVVIGDVGTNLRLDYTVMGDVVNTASRLHEIAKSGEILVAEETYRKTAHCFDFQKLKPVDIRGKSQPVQVYRVLQRKEKALRARGIEGLSSPFVGRNEEFDTCKQVVDQLLIGKGGTLIITGEAGLGKSRLAEEIKSYTGYRDITWLEGKCASYTSSINYWVFVGVLRNYFGIKNDADVIEAEDILKKKRVMNSVGESAIPTISSLLSSKQQKGKTDEGLTATEKKLRIFTIIKDILIAESRANPVILMLDDLHWIDDLSMELLLFLMRELAHHRVAFFCIYRSMAGKSDVPPIQQLERKCLHSKSAVSVRTTRVVLSPLSNVDSNLLLSSLLAVEDLPLKIKGIILEKAGGNPLYLEEVIRSIIDSKIIEKRNGRWLATGDIEDIEVPDTVQEVIMARIDRLEAEPKHVLQCASVVGRSFEYESLSYLVTGEIASTEPHSPGDDRSSPLESIPSAASEAEEAYPSLPSRSQALDEHLKALERMGFILREGENKSVLKFRHGLIQDVAYSTILKRRRRELHETICHYIEETHRENPEEFYEILAYHYSNSDDIEAAILYLVKAGHKNRRSAVGSAESALQNFHKALDMLNNFSVADDKYAMYKCEIHDGIGEAYIDLGDYEKALSSFETVSLACEQTDDRRMKAIALRQIGNNKERLRDWEGAQKAYEESLSIARELGDLSQMSLAYNMIGLGYLDRGDMDEAIAYFQEALGLGEQAGDLRVIGDASDGLGTVASIRHDFSAAIRYFETSLRSRKEAGESHFEAQIYHNLGTTHFRKGEPEIADKYYEESLKISEKCGYNSLIAVTYLNRAELSLEQSDLDRATDFCAKAFEILRTLDDKWAVAEGYKLYGVIYERRGRFQSARDAFNRSLAVSEECDYVTNIAEVQRIMGLMCKKQGRLDEALEHLDKAREIFSDIRIEDEVQNVDRCIEDIKQEIQQSSGKASTK